MFILCIFDENKTQFNMKNIILITFMFSLSTAWCATAFSQNLSVNNTGNSADASAILDVSADSLGVLIPRVSLTDTMDVLTISNPTTSLVVYNDDAIPMDGGVGEGFYSFNGSKWVPLIQAVNSPGTNGQVLTSNGTGVLPEWESFTISGGGGGPALGSGSCQECPTEATLIDPFTGASSHTWIDAAEYCRTLNFNGNTDWRMPTFDESTYVLVNIATPTATAGSGRVSWTATKSDDGTDTKWLTIDTSNGVRSSRSASTFAYIFCVR